MSWQGFSFPEEELAVRSMVGDPEAAAAHALQLWMDSQDFKQKLTLTEVLQCIWSHKHGDIMTRYEIITLGGVYIPDAIPSEVYSAVYDCVL